jgi:hypothetical protein
MHMVELDGEPIRLRPSGFAGHGFVYVAYAWLRHA